ncbi:MAG: hypothetical protein JWN37_941 [Candidatus Nomurabacteria bacterium]|nr:hypothetical protein [Candidatus Nomurabacteria bacterium]
MGSFNRRSDYQIRLSQATWRTHYDLGKSGHVLEEAAIEKLSPTARDGYTSGWAKFFGMSPEPIKPAPPRMTREEENRAQYERGNHMGREAESTGNYLPEDLLSKCHPEFVRGYHDGERASDPIDDDVDWVDSYLDRPLTSEENRLADIAAEYRVDPEY